MIGNVPAANRTFDRGKGGCPPESQRYREDDAKRFPHLLLDTRRRLSTIQRRGRAIVPIMVSATQRSPRLR